MKTYAKRLVSQRFALSDTVQAYNTARDTAKERTFKVVLESAS